MSKQEMISGGMLVFEPDGKPKGAITNDSDASSKKDTLINPVPPPTDNPTPGIFIDPETHRSIILSLASGSDYPTGRTGDPK